MKKVLTVLSILGLLVCFFTIGVSAEEPEFVNNLGDPTWYTGTLAELMNDKTSRVVLANGDGTYTAYPSYYIIQPQYVNAGTGAVVLYNNAYGKDGIVYSWLNEQTGKSYGNGSIYKIEIPNGITQLNVGIFGTNNGGQSHVEPNVTEVILPDSVTSLNGQVFRTAINLKRVVLSKNITSIADWTFSGSSALEEVVIPEGSLLESISGFRTCTSLKEIDLSNCTNLKTVAGYAFDNCTALGKVTLPDSVETFGDRAFYMCTNMYFASDFLPSSLTSVGQYFLEGCKVGNETYVFPVGVTELGTYAFSNYGSAAGRTNLVFLGKMTYVNLSGTKWKDANSGGYLSVYFAQNVPSDIKGYFVEAKADESGVLYYIAKYSDGSFPEETDGTLTISFNRSDAINSGSNYGSGTDSEGNTVYKISANVINFNFCTTSERIYVARNSFNSWRYNLTNPFNVDNAHKLYHTEALDATCTTEGNIEYYRCACCEKYYTSDAATTEITGSVILSALGHDVALNKITYVNGFDKAGSKIYLCSRCTYTESAEAVAIFKALGYSTKKTADAIYGGFELNATALSEYNSCVEAGKELRYGIVIVNMGATVADKASLAFTASGVVDSTKAIQVEIKDTSFTRFGFTLTGFTTDELKALNLVISAYVIDGDGNMSFVQNEGAMDGTYYVKGIDAYVGDTKKGTLGIMTFTKVSTLA